MRVVAFVTLLCASTFGERYSDMSCLVVFDASNCRCKALQKPEPRFCRSSVGTTKVCWTYATLRSANPTVFRSHASSSSASFVSSDASSICAPDGAWANLMGRCSCWSFEYAKNVGCLERFDLLAFNNKSSIHRERFRRSRKPKACA
jgi:hypothetical protein